MKAVLVFIAAAGCSSSKLALPPDDCNPLGDNHCMTPWPNSAFEVADATSTITGRRLAIPATTLPANFEHVHVDPTQWNLADGFSPSAPLMMSFKGGVSPDGLIPPDNMDVSTTAQAPTVILDMTTGELVAHFSEIDMRPLATSAPDSQALFLRPAQRLVGGHRYAAAITKQVKAANGKELAVPPGFTALVHGTKTDHPLLEAMRPRFSDVLSALAQAGFPASDLVVAWDFTVASDEFIHSDMIAARDRALAALQNHPIGYTIKSDAPIGDGTMIQREVQGTLDAPLFLTNMGTNEDGTVIARDAQGLPAVQGFYQIPFVAIVPACAYTSTTPVGMVIYGHGLLGSSQEVAGAVQQTTAAQLCVVFVGTDMRGMSQQDLGAVQRTLDDASNADQFTEVIEQGLVNHVTLVQAARTTFAQTLFVDAANANKVLVDPSKVTYYGLSQGAIMGTAVMAYEPTMTRGVLGAGGANFSLLLDRSTGWTTDQVLINAAYKDPLDDELIMALIQMRWDKTEGAGVVNSVLTGSGLGVPPKQLLMQTALGDDAVSNFGTYWEVRSMGAPVMGPTPYTPWGLTVQNAPLPPGSALVIEQGSAALPPLTNTPPPALGMHNLTREQAASRRQIADFFNTGQIINECDGACTCQTGACN
jgi:predicted esterase